MSSVKLAATASDRVRLDVGPDTLTVSSFDPSKGDPKSSITDVMPCRADTPAVIVGAQEFVQPILDAMTGDEVTITYKAGTVKPITLTDGRVRAVFVPIRWEK